MADIKEMIEGMNNTFTEFKQKQLELDEKIKKGEATGEVKAQIEKMQAAMDQYELKMQRPNFGPDLTKGNFSELEVKRLDSFNKFLRTGEETKELKEMMTEFKAMSGGVPADGGNLVPQILSNMIIEKLKEISPIRQIAKTITIGIGNELQIPRKTKAAAGGWIGDIAARPATDSPQFDLLKIPVAEMYANCAITSNLLEDQAFNLESYISNDIRTTFAQLEGSAFVNGDGTNKPYGLLAGADAAGGFVSIKSGAAATFTFDSILALVYGLSSQFAQNAKFVMKRDTIRFVRTLKDLQNNYLWQPSNIPGQPSTLCGHPVIEAEDMPAIAAGAFPIAFGDFMEGYNIVDKRGMTMLRDPYSNKPFVNFYATARVGGKVANTEAVKLLKITA